MKRFYEDDTSDGIYGYGGKEAVESLGAEIDEAYEEVIKKIGDIMVADVLEPLSKAWYSPYAANYYKDLNEQFDGDDGINVHVLNAFNSYKRKVAEAVTKWETTAQVEGEVADLSDATKKDFDFETRLAQGNIQIREADDSKKVYIDVNNAGALATTIDGIPAKITEELNNIEYKLDNASAFLGGDQAKNLKDCFAQIGTQIAHLFNGVAQLASKLRDAIEEYETTARTNAENLQNIEPGE